MLQSGRGFGPSGRGFGLSGRGFGSGGRGFGLSGRGFGSSGVVLALVEVVWKWFGGSGLGPS